MYLDYWGLKKHAFNNVPDPDMYFEMHETVENTVAELLFAIEEGDECLAVVVGEVGLGKTMSLRVILDTLDPEKYAIAFITNPDISFVQLLREIIGQLTNSPCAIRAKDRLLEEFNRLLFEVADNGKRVVIFIDEGNAIRRVNLDNLRLLTNMQEDDRNLFTMILAGQPELARNLEHPSMANLFQRIGVYCKLQKMASRDIVKFYIEHRLERAGATKPIFTEEAYDKIYTLSEFGIPRLVNRLCKLCLKAGETNELSEIDGSVVAQIGSRFERSVDLTRKPPHEHPPKAAPEPEKAHPAEKIRVVNDEEISEILLHAPLNGESTRSEIPEATVVAEPEPAFTPGATEIENPAATADEIARKVIGKIHATAKPMNEDEKNYRDDTLREVLDRMKRRHSRQERGSSIFGG
jgi:general secretion pathway protein A